MFGMVAANGIKVLSNVDFLKNHHNLFIVAVSIGLGLVPVVSPRWQGCRLRCRRFCTAILLASVSAVVLNVVFNGVRKEREAKCAIHAAGQEFDGTAQASEAK